MVKAVIFDMDGVIIDSEMEYLQFDLSFAQTKNPDARLEHLFGMVGASKEDAWRCMERAINNGQSWQELRDEFHTTVNAFAQVDYRKMYRPEVTEILTHLKDLGLKIALSSSTQMDIILRVLEENEIRKYFDVVVSGQQFKKSKPDPEIYHYTAKALKVSEIECFVIEDSTFGIMAASRAGMQIAALIDKRFGFDQSLADYHVERLLDVIPIIEKEAHVIQ